MQLLEREADVQRRARELAEGYLANPASVSPTLVASVLRVAAFGGDASLYDRFLARMNESRTSPEEYYRIFNALAAFVEPSLVQRTLNLALSSQVRSQDTPLLLAALLVSSETQDAAWAFIKDRWSPIMDKVGVFQGVPALVNALGAFCSTDRAAEITAYFAAHPVPEAARGLQQALERINACAAIQARQAPALTRWLAAAARPAA
jgi:aminopeptidase N